MKDLVFSSKTTNTVQNRTNINLINRNNFVIPISNTSTFQNISLYQNWGNGMHYPTKLKTTHISKNSAKISL